MHPIIRGGGEITRVVGISILGVLGGGGGPPPVGGSVSVCPPAGTAGPTFPPPPPVSSSPCGGGTSLNDPGVAFIQSAVLSIIT